MSRRCELLGVGRLVGNNVSKSNRKTKRTFLPNLIQRKLESALLRTTFHLKISAKANRTVLKHGSFDDFLINVKPTNLTDFAKLLRAKILRQNPDIVEKIKSETKKPSKKVS